MKRLPRFGNSFPRFEVLPLLGLAALLSTAGCHSNPDASGGTASAPAQTTAQDQSGDPAAANLAPVSAATTGAASSSADASGGGGASYSGVDYQQAAAQYSDDDDASNEEPPAATAPDPPPALPDYQQPEDPGDGYIWTPGYWNYASAGYYWVPGVWVQAPYQEALWTPSYWGYANNHYEFFRGYWGRHIGFYGGVNYGFGYGGVGYQGGYWNSGHFFYNRSVNNINVAVVHNVYVHPVPASNVRISFHGGPAGIRVRPLPAELVAWHEPHAAPMSAQVQIDRAASTNRAQFAEVNRGRPASFVVAKAVMADHNVRPVAPPARIQPAAQQRGPGGVMHPSPAEAARPGVPAAPERPGVEHPAPGRAEPRAAEHTAPAERPAPARPEAPPAAQHAAPARPEAPPQHATPSRPEPAAQHAGPARPAPAEKPAPAKPAAHPQPKPERPEDEHPR